MNISTVPEDLRQKLDEYASQGVPCEINVKTPKGVIYCKLQNLTAE